MTRGLFTAYSNRPPSFVLDVAVAAAWSVTRRGNPYTVAVQWRLMREAAAVPSLWLPALADALLAAERAGETTQARTTRFISTLPTLPILVDDETEFRAWTDTLDLARTHSVSVSDAAYLELAARVQLPIATTDADLTRAATTAGVPIFTP